MSLVRLLPAWLHAIADYAVALSLIVVAIVVDGPGKAMAAGVVIGAVVLVVSLLTRYPLGLIKVLPFKVHSAGDYLAAVLLVASPFALGFTHSARGLTIFYIGAGVAVLLVSLVTNYQYSPKGQALGESAVRGRSTRAQVQPTAYQADRRLAPSYPPQGTPASNVPEAAPQPASVDQSWRTLVDPGFRPPAAGPVRLPEAEVTGQPVPEPFSPDTGSQSRPLREILAERAANKRSVA